MKVFQPKSNEKKEKTVTARPHKEGGHQRLYDKGKEGKEARASRGKGDAYLA